MWFTKQADGMRAWFALVDKNGVLRPGAAASAFTVTVVDPADTTSNTPAVSESSTKGGLYTFLIPTAFITTNGVGDYGVVVEVNAATPPKVIDVMSKVLRVDVQDFDSLGVAADYAGAIHIDTKNGSAGAVVGVNGTTTNPVSNLADAVTLAAAVGVRRYSLIGNITLTSAHDDWVVVGKAADAAVNLGTQDVADSLFNNCQLSGTILTGPIQAINCDLDGVGAFTGHAHSCGLTNSTSMGTGTVTFTSCYSAVPGLSTPSLDLNGVASLNLRAYSGGIELQGVTGVGQNVTLEISQGQVILAASCTAGNITLRGIGNLTNNSAGSTVEKNAFLNIDAIFDEVVDDGLSLRTTLTYLLSMAAGEFTELVVDVGPPEIREYTFKDHAGVTTYVLRITDSSGRTRTSG
jgi:hypothetical protein